MERSRVYPILLLLLLLIVDEALEFVTTEFEIYEWLNDGEFMKPLLLLVLLLLIQEFKNLLSLLDGELLLSVNSLSWFDDKCVFDDDVVLVILFAELEDVCLLRLVQ